MSEVEKLKQARREANAAKRAAGIAVSTDGGENQTGPPPPPEPAAAPSGPLDQIAAAEEMAAAAMAEIEAVTALIEAADTSEALDAAAKRQAAVSAVVGKMVVMMDEIDLGVIEDDEARSAARARRKAVNKRCALASSGDVEVDGDLAAASEALKKATVNKRRSRA